MKALLERPHRELRLPYPAAAPMGGAAADEVRLGFRSIFIDFPGLVSQEQPFKGQFNGKSPKNNGKITPGTGHASHRWDSRAFPPTTQTGTQCRGAGA
jgi:hypothetical protein